MWLRAAGSVGVPMTPYYSDPLVTLLHGDCIEVLRDLEADSVDSIVTDPPAGIAFMSKHWDRDKGGRTEWVAWMTDVMRECHRVLKPGGYALVWSIPRTCHWTAWAMEDAGFIIRDQLAHIFASGFPKGKAQLKPAREDWWLARKPGPTMLPLGIEACRIGGPDGHGGGARASDVPVNGFGVGGYRKGDGFVASQVGRWPSNVLLSDPELFDEPNPGIIGSGSTEDGGAGYSRFFAIPGERMDRFWSKVKKSGGCWEWTGGTDERGYGRLWGDDQNRSLKAHRVSWELANGPIPDGMHVLHHCDNPPCVNPAHLWLGTHDDNMADMVAKGRTGWGDLKGEDRYNAQLTEEIVREARALHAEGWTYAQLEERYGVHQRVISKAVRGISWKHVTDDPEHPIGLIVPKADRAERERGLDDRPKQVIETQGKAEGASFRDGEWVLTGDNRKPRANVHPTVKPIDLMRHLVRLVTPPGGVVLDPFLGSGTTALAASEEGFRCIGIEREAEYLEIAKGRLMATPMGLGLDHEIAGKAPPKTHPDLSKHQPKRRAPSENYTGGWAGTESEDAA